MTQTNILRIHAEKKYDKIKKNPYLPNLIFHQCYPKHTFFYRPKQASPLFIHMYYNG